MHRLPDGATGHAALVVAHARSAMLQAKKATLAGNAGSMPGTVPILTVLPCAPRVEAAADQAKDNLHDLHTSRSVGT